MNRLQRENERLKTWLLFAICLGLAGCRGKVLQPDAAAKDKAPVRQASSKPDEPGSGSCDTPSGAGLLQLVGKTVTAYGRFELYGVQGPFIDCNGKRAYLTSGHSFIWGPKFEQMEGKPVSITGVLRFRHDAPSNQQHPPDYFYFDAEARSTIVQEEVSRNSDDDLRALIGQTVTLRGRLSEAGKFGPYISLDNNDVYLVAKASFSSPQSYAGMEGKLVTVTGALRFYQSPTAWVWDDSIARAPDYFYFEQESAKVQPVRH